MPGVAAAGGAVPEVPMEEAIALLRQRKSPFLQGMLDAELKRLAQHSRAVAFTKSQAVLRNCDDVHSMYILHTGRLEVLSPETKPLGVVEGGGVVGEYGLLSCTLKGAIQVNVVRAGREGALVLELTYESLRRVKGEKYCERVLAMHDELEDIARRLRMEYIRDITLPTAVIIPTFEGYSKNKAGSHPELIAQYRRLQVQATKARLGAGLIFFHFERDSHTRAALEGRAQGDSKFMHACSQFDVREGGLVIEKVLPDDGTKKKDAHIAPPMNPSATWASIPVQPILPQTGQVYIEFKIERQGGSLCELLIGVCEASTERSQDELAWQHAQAWMYYCQTGRIYTQGFGCDISSQRIAGAIARQGDTVGILVDQTPKSPIQNPDGRCVSIFVNGAYQGPLVQERTLLRGGGTWPDSLCVCMDAHGQGQVVRLVVEKTAVVAPGGVPFKNLRWDKVHDQWRDGGPAALQKVRLGEGSL